MMEYETVVTAMTVLPRNAPIYSERATTIKLDDEAAGLFVVLEQSNDKGTQRIALDVEEWPHIQRAVNQLVQICQARNAKEGA